MAVRVEQKTKKRELPPEKTKVVRMATPEQRRERLGKLLSGDEKPKGELLPYLLGQLRKVLDESDRVNKLLRQNEEAVEQAKTRMFELRGMRAQYIADIHHWDDIEFAKETKEQVA